MKAGGFKSEGIDALSESIKSEKSKLSEKKCGIESGNAGREWEGLGSASAHPVRSHACPLLAFAPVLLQYDND